MSLARVDNRIAPESHDAARTGEEAGDLVVESMCLCPGSPPASKAAANISCPRTGATALHGALVKM